MVVFYAMKISRDFTYASFLTFVTLNVVVLSYAMNNDRSIGALETAHSHLKSLGNSTEQMIRLQSLVSNRSDDTKAIRNPHRD